MTILAALLGALCIAIGLISYLLGWGLTEVKLKQRDYTWQVRWLLFAYGTFALITGVGVLSELELSPVFWLDL